MLKIDTSNFEAATKALNERVRHNVAAYGQSLARGFETTGKADAPWVDHTGGARARLTGLSAQSGDKVTVKVGGSAPQYKTYERAKKRYADYLQFLEFANKRRFAIVYPLVYAMADDVRANFGNAALNGGHGIRVRINRRRLKG